jgi:hypothetical protein
MKIERSKEWWMAKAAQEAKYDLIEKRLKLLERIRGCGNSISDKMQQSVGGDSMSYIGGMNAVELFRDAEAEYVSFLFSNNMVDCGDDDE